MIEVKNVSKTFGENKVLDDVSAKFETGKVNLIIGASGQGKSVLAKCIVGLHEVDEGSIFYDELDFCVMSPEDRRKIRTEIGMLFQGSALFDSMTVEQNIIFPLSMFTKMSKSEMLDRANFCLERVNLAGRNKLFPAECSGGMQKRIAIARAIAMNPKYLFCDEPNSGLDPLTSRVIDELISDITKEYDITTIINTHDMKSLFVMGENIIFIHQGQKWWEGEKAEIRPSGNKELLAFMEASEF